MKARERRNFSLTFPEFLASLPWRQIPAQAMRVAEQAFERETTEEAAVAIARRILASAVAAARGRAFAAQHSRSAKNKILSARPHESEKTYSRRSSGAEGSCGDLYSGDGKEAANEVPDSSNVQLCIKVMRGLLEKVVRAQKDLERQGALQETLSPSVRAS